jgi:hypothetical protein
MSLLETMYMAHHVPRDYDGFATATRGREHRI